MCDCDLTDTSEAWCPTAHQYDKEKGAGLARVKAFFGIFTAAGFLVCLSLAAVAVARGKKDLKHRGGAPLVVGG